VEQVVAQTPLLQTCPAVQATPHAPQLAGSLLLSTQFPGPHSNIPAGQTQWLSLHSCDCVHTVSHAPQWAAFAVTSMQPPLQFVSGAVQASPH
jgi:hypothetical protein